MFMYNPNTKANMLQPFNVIQIETFEKRRRP